MGREYGVFVLLFAICAVLLYSQYEVFLSANKREDVRNKYLISHIPTIALQTVDSNIRKGVNRVIQTEYVESTPDVTYPYVSLQEILRNGSVVRPELFHKPAYQSIRYEWGKTTCQNVSAEVPNTTRLILNRKFITVNKINPVSWSTFEAKRRHSIPGTWLKTKFNWWYGENFCLENNTNLIHVYTRNYTHFLLLNQTLQKLWIPHDRSNYRHALRVIPHFGDIPENRTVLDDMYVFINRGWNNMYHHSEWAIQVVRYILLSALFPPLRNIVQFPDIDWINHHTHDFKFHYRYGRNYLDLVLDSFKADLNGVDLTPHLFEGKEYKDAGSAVCAKQGIVAPIIADMIKCFIDKKEAYQIRMLAYKRYKPDLPLTSPAKLQLRYTDRKTKNRGISNQDEIVEVLRLYNQTELTIQVNQQMSFAEQVISMFSIDILFTVHGAGLTSVLFMLPGSGMIEVFPPLFKEPYYMWVSRFSDIVYRRISETRIVDKKAYRYVTKKIDLTNKIFYLPPHLVTNKLDEIVPLVWEKKYTLQKCHM